MAKESKKKSKKKNKSTPKVSAITASEDEEFSFLEPDEWYKAELEEAEVGAGLYGPYIKFSFKVLSGETENGESAKGRIVSRLMNATLSPSQPLWKWGKVFLKREPKIGETLDLTAFYGERYRILVKYKKQKKGDSRKYQTVDTIKRLKKTRG